MPYDYYQIQQLEVLEVYKTGIVVGDVRLSRIDFISILYPGSNERIKILESLKMTEKEEYFAEFFSKAYNKGKDIDSMTLPELDAWIRKLEEVAFEAKASLQGATQAKREREATLKAGEREKLRNADGTYSSTDAINAVNKRKDRMSKVDKLRDTYKAMGMLDADIDSLLLKVKVEENLPTAKIHLVKNEADKLANEQIEDKPKTLLEKIADSVINAPKSEPSKPFDASTLFPKKAQG